MNQPNDLALEDTIASELDNAALDVAERELDPITRRQVAIVAIGRRAMAPPDLSVLMMDAAALAADNLQVDGYGVTKLNGPGQGMILSYGGAETADQPDGTARYELEVDQSHSLSGYALGITHPVIVTDLDKEDRFADSLLKRLGICSALVCPLAQTGQPFGVLGVYSTTPRQFDKTDVLFLESIAHVITATLARDRAEQELERQQDIAEVLLSTTEALHVVLTPDGRIRELNRASQKTTGFQLHEVQDRPIGSALLIPEEVNLVQGELEQLRRGESPVQFESYVLTKLGERRRVAWSFAASQDSDGAVQSLVGTGIDITEKYEALKRAEWAEAEAEEARRSLAHLKEQIEMGELSFDDGSTEVAGFPEKVKSDRRVRIRRSFPYLQPVAPIIDGRQPKKEELREVRCRDISARGFSFLAPESPNYKEMIAGFGTPPSLIYVTAEVRHVTACAVDGRTMYLIGCRYTGRAEL